jgi:hypothetical protein
MPALLLIVLQLGPAELSLADSLFTHGDFYDAATEYERCVFAHAGETLPPIVRHRLAQSYARSGEFDRARRVFDALPADSLEAETRYQTALGLLEHDQPAPARLELNDLLLLDCDPELKRRASRQLAWLDASEGDMGQAGRSFRLAGDSALAQYAVRLSSLPQRRPELAVLLSSLLPGTGELYAGNLKYGLLSLLVNSATATGTVYSLSKGNYMDAALLFSVFFVRFYFGSRSNARDFAEDFNQRQAARAAQELRKPATARTR